MRKQLTQEEIQELKKVPDWMRNKIAKHYVHSEIEKSADGKTVEWTIRVGDHVAVRLEGKRHPETEEEWQRMNDILEIDHYINWMKRFCEQMSLIEDREVENAMKKTEVPSDEELDWMQKGGLTFMERLSRLTDSFISPRTIWGRVIQGITMIALGYAINYFWLKIGL